MKKSKKQKKVKSKFVLGTKIRDVKINEKQHFLMFVSMLVFFNLMLLLSVWFVLIKLNNWYYWVICCTLLLLSFWLSFRTYRDIKSFNRCELFDNAISINSIWNNLNIPFKDIREMKVKVSVLDKLFKLNTKSLEVKILHHKIKKVVIHFIEEDAVKLKQEITMLIDIQTQKQEEFKVEEKTSEN